MSTSPHGDVLGLISPILELVNEQNLPLRVALSKVDRSVMDLILDEEAFQILVVYLDWDQVRLMYAWHSMYHDYGLRPSWMREVLDVD